jgi:hypothetical protein
MDGSLEKLHALEQGTTQQAAMAYYDTLAPARIEDLIGAWRGSEVPTAHPFDGLLAAFGWHGKRFDGPDEAHPLLFDDGKGGVVSINPSLMPMSLTIRYAGIVRSPLAQPLFRLVRPLLATRSPRARLRMTEYRGVVSATMSYDALPINDVFRKVDGDTLLGAMDMRGVDAPFVFVLRRES